MFHDEEYADDPAVAAIQEIIKLAEQAIGRGKVKKPEAVTMDAAPGDDAAGGEDADKALEALSDVAGEHGPDGDSDEDDGFTIKGEPKSVSVLSVTDTAKPGSALGALEKKLPKKVKF